LQYKPIVDLTRARVQNIMPSAGAAPAVDVLRIDEIHPIISGNKYFKLRYYLERAVETGCRGIITYGGPWSNHLVAAAEAAKECGLDSIGYVRGERPKWLSAALQDAAAAGMDLRFLSRGDYRVLSKDGVASASDPQWLVIPEGGAGPLGIRGAATIASLFDQSLYDLVICAAGTGTMLSGLASVLPSATHLIGISVLKGEDRIGETIARDFPRANFEVITGYHFGGYARWDTSLLQFMNSFYDTYGIGLDFVYTGKLFYAVMEKLQAGDFAKYRRLLVIHSGGMQGNRSMPAGTFHFA
jgi:1-aminocyclopropane-1-carboxylate deaminase